LLYLPKSWIDDPARLKATYVPSDMVFATKPQLAARMIERLPRLWHSDG
jgi:SRSO17 transposase